MEKRDFTMEPIIDLVWEVEEAISEDDLMEPSMIMARCCGGCGFGDWPGCASLSTCVNLNNSRPTTRSPKSFAEDLLANFPVL